MKKLFVIAAVLALAGCGDNPHPVSDLTINKAQELCEKNDGISRIENGAFYEELVGCGLKCMRPSGVIRHEGDLTCKNGARFKINIRIKEGE